MEKRLTIIKQKQWEHLSGGGFFLGGSLPGTAGASSTPVETKHDSPPELLANAKNSIGGRMVKLACANYLIDVPLEFLANAKTYIGGKRVKLSNGKASINYELRITNYEIRNNGGAPFVEALRASPFVEALRATPLQRVPPSLVTK
jgi:hypothetical protein